MSESHYALCVITKPRFEVTLRHPSIVSVCVCVCLLSPSLLAAGLDLRAGGDGDVLRASPDETPLTEVLQRESSGARLRDHQHHRPGSPERCRGSRGGSPTGYPFCLRTGGVPWAGQQADALRPGARICCQKQTELTDCLENIACVGTMIKIASVKDTPALTSKCVHVFTCVWCV